MIIWIDYCKFSVETVHNSHAAGRRCNQAIWSKQFFSPCVALDQFTFLMPHRCNMIKAIIRAVRVAHSHLVMTSLAKQFTALQILSVIAINLKNFAQVPFNKLLKSLTSMPNVVLKSVHRNHEGTIGHNWRHNCYQPVHVSMTSQ